MGARLLRKQTDTRRIIWRGDDALAAEIPGAWIDAEVAPIREGATPTVFTIRGVGNAEMSRIYALTGAGELQAEAARLLLAASCVVSIANGAEEITDRGAVISALESEYPCGLYLDLGEEVQRIAEGGPPGARQFRRSGDPADASANGSADRPLVPGVPEGSAV